MHQRRTLLAFTITVALVTASCSDWGLTGPGGRDFEGFYSYAGTVDDALGDGVVGTIIITRQRGSRADVSIDWSYIERGLEVVRITTDRAARADLRSDGRIDFEFTGDLRDGPHLVGFRLTHEGRLRGDRIDGNWRLRTDYPTTDRGSFIARR